ncbi:MAG: glycosyltransferase family 61 protein [Sphingomonadales bacterium]|nr:glycosyltransferase family 61 protein [Sphingomonadales bacterium]
MTFLFRRALNRLSPTTLKAAAVSSRIVSPALEIGDRPSIHVPGEFDAIINVVNGDRELEWKRISGAVRSHLPTIEYVLEKVRIKDSYLASGRFVQHFRTRMPPDAGTIGPRVFDQAILSSNSLSGLEFGHWVRDSLVAEMHGLNEQIPAVGNARGAWPHEPDFRRLSGLMCQYVQDCRIGRLVVLDDRGHNAYWRGRFLALRDRLRASVSGLPGKSAGPLILLGRGAGGRIREPSNMPAIQVLLEALGFKTVVPTDLSLSEIGVMLRDARIVVSAEGSHLNHLHFFAPAGTALILLQDPRRFYAYHKGLVDFYDGVFGFVVGRPDPEAPELFTINADTLERTLDLVEAALTTRS